MLDLICIEYPVKYPAYGTGTPMNLVYFPKAKTS